MVSTQTNNMLPRPIFHVEPNGAIGGFSYPSCSNVFGCISAAAIFCLPSTQHDMGVEKEW
eukprot:scaffold2430_cov163-Skeletonema_marinoi.AAC.1